MISIERIPVYIYELDSKEVYTIRERPMYVHVHCTWTYNVRERTTYVNVQRTWTYNVRERTMYVNVQRTWTYNVRERTTYVNVQCTWTYTVRSRTTYVVHIIKHKLQRIHRMEYTQTNLQFQLIISRGCNEVFKYKTLVDSSEWSQSCYKTIAGISFLRDIQTLLFTHYLLYSYSYFEHTHIYIYIYIYIYIFTTDFI